MSWKKYTTAGRGGRDKYELIVKIFMMLVYAYWYIRKAHRYSGPEQPEAWRIEQSPFERIALQDPNHRYDLKKQLSFVSGVEVPPNAGIEEYKNGRKFMDKEQHDFAIYILQARINLTEETIILTTTSETSFVFKQSTTHMSANKGVKIDNLRLFFEVQTSQKRNIIIIIAHKGVTIVNFCLYFEVQTSQKSKRETYLSN